MESLEISAKTVEEATQRALEKLGVPREKVKVTILKEGRHGILSLGAEEATIRVEPLMPTPEEDITIAEVAKGFFEALLTKM